uniref:Factor of DNA methylation 1-5/IDN2 domain-containing protein n=1 Tax=Lactuca sativa TaxID=4236 RepID=A0A9R1VIQ0_LACSA|nr:hypothetical protein LSAT_V11C500291040 [Lactuca sativa]
MHAYYLKTVIENITEDCEKFLQDYKQRFLQTEALSKSLQQREDELKKKERKLLKGKRKLELKKRVREQLSSCKHLVNQCYSSRKVAEGVKRELDMLHKRRTELEDQLKAESFESLQSEIIQLEIALQVVEDNDQIDLQEKLKNLQRELIEKGEKLQELKDQAKVVGLVIQGNNDELQDARQEFIDGLKTYPCSTYDIDIKTMGELDLAPFCDGYHSTKRAKKNTLMNAIDFWLECKYLVEDQNWHPFTIITVGSDIKEIIDEEDEKIVRLKGECSKEQYHAVVTALNERNQYNSADCMQEIWNFKEQRKASLKECIDYILKECMEDP